jgi:dihydrofolate synthase / folylpolyglutamate synthase
MSLTYQQALDYIHSFDDPYLAAIRDHGKQTWGLSRIRAHLAYPTIHIAGTKGKGSTSAFIAQGLIASGLRTGLYISPHLQNWRERISINRAMISEDDLAQLVHDYQQTPTHIEGLSAFEVSTALAFWHFARQSCEVGVIEVGLGGRLDATSVVEPVVSVITNISLDHMQFLGETLGEIAGEKAAIIKAGTQVISAPQPPEALAVIEAKAREMNSPLTLIGKDWTATPISMGWDGSEAEIGSIDNTHRVRIALPGLFQIENAATAAAALKAVQSAGVAVKDDAIWRAMSEITWPGRLEIAGRDPLVVLDSAHNPHSMERLIEALEALGGYEHLTFVFGCMADKHALAMLRTLLPNASRVVFTRINHDRAAHTEDLRAYSRALIQEALDRGEGWARDLELSTAPDVASAIALALGKTGASDALVVAGSMALAGEARTVLESVYSSKQPQDR